MRTLYRIIIGCCVFAGLLWWCCRNCAHVSREPGAFQNDGKASREALSWPSLTNKYVYVYQNTIQLLDGPHYEPNTIHFAYEHARGVPFEVSMDVDVESVVCLSATSNLWCVFYEDKSGTAVVKRKAFLGEWIGKEWRFSDVVDNEAVFVNRAGSFYYLPITSHYCPAAVQFGKACDDYRKKAVKAGEDGPPVDDKPPALKP